MLCLSKISRKWPFWKGRVMGGQVTTFLSTDAALFGISRFAGVFRSSPTKSPKSPRASLKVCSPSANSPSLRSSKKSLELTISTSPSPECFKFGWDLPWMHLQLHTYGVCIKMV